MKHLLYLLIVLNSVYFAWHMVHGMSDGEVVRELPPLPPDTRRLMTLQELQEQREKEESPAETDSPVDDRAEAQGEEMLAGIESLTTQLSLFCRSIPDCMSDSKREFLIVISEQVSVRIPSTFS